MKHYLRYKRCIGGVLLLGAFLCVPGCITTCGDSARQSVGGEDSNIRKLSQPQEITYQLPKSIDNAWIAQLCYESRLLTREDLAEFPSIQKQVTEYCDYLTGEVPGETNLQMLSKIVTQEIGGITDATSFSTGNMEKAAVVWCILNRVDLWYTPAGEQPTAEYIHAAATYPNAFAYYKNKVPFEGISELVEDVLIRWTLEKYLTEDILVEDSTHWYVSSGHMVGRVLPQEYVFFGGDGKHNYFRIVHDVSSPKWRWDYRDPYK